MDAVGVDKRRILFRQQGEVRYRMRPDTERTSSGPSYRVRGIATKQVTNLHFKIAASLFLHFISRNRRCGGRCGGDAARNQDSETLRFGASVTDDVIGHLHLEGSFLADRTTRSDEDMHSSSATHRDGLAAVVRR